MVITTDVQKTARGGTPPVPRTAPQREGARGGICSCHSEGLPPLSHPPGDWTRSATDFPQQKPQVPFLYARGVVNSSKSNSKNGIPAAMLPTDPSDKKNVGRRQQR
ncbi:hypothetical protein ILYODFUR_004004 [Ilyodon furcidens]|uniref:Uncharacterized protein n=1 Tax=Ilyodon furcidens TaxID=33524 RepID=A0ABV0VBI6_9TELE